MKRCVGLVMCVVLMAILCAGCGESIDYGGADASGQTAADVVRDYYRLWNANRDHLMASAYHDRLEGGTVVNYDTDLIGLSYCEVVPYDRLPKSELDWIAAMEGEVAACCYVQTADVIQCKEDCAYGVKDEKVSRQYHYLLVRETEGADWQIYDFGNPPIYIPD